MTLHAKAVLQTLTADSERSSAAEASASSLDVRSVPRHRLKKQTSLLHAGPTDKHTRPARQNEAYDNCVFVVLGFTPFVPMGPKTRPRRKLFGSRPRPQNWDRARCQHKGQRTIASPPLSSARRRVERLAMPPCTASPQSQPMHKQVSHPGQIGRPSRQPR